MSNNNKEVIPMGKAIAIIVLIVLVGVGLIGGIFFFVLSSTSSTGTGGTQTIAQGESSPPVVNPPVTNVPQNPPAVIEATEPSRFAGIDTTNWNTFYYSDGVLRFTFNHPSDWIILEERTEGFNVAVDYGLLGSNYHILAGNQTIINMRFPSMPDNWSFSIGLRHFTGGSGFVEGFSALYELLPSFGADVTMIEVERYVDGQIITAPKIVLTHEVDGRSDRVGAYTALAPPHFDIHFAYFITSDIENPATFEEMSQYLQYVSQQLYRSFTLLQSGETTNIAPNQFAVVGSVANNVAPTPAPTAESATTPIRFSWEYFDASPQIAVMTFLQSMADDLGLSIDILDMQPIMDFEYMQVIVDLGDGIGLGTDYFLLAANSPNDIYVAVDVSLNSGRPEIFASERHENNFNAAGGWSIVNDALVEFDAFIVPPTQQEQGTAPQTPAVERQFPISDWTYHFDNLGRIQYSFTIENPDRAFTFFGPIMIHFFDSAGTNIYTHTISLWGGGGSAGVSAQSSRTFSGTHRLETAGVSTRAASASMRIFNGTTLVESRTLTLSGDSVFLDD
ncbi:MAG: hypothetical protein FWF79_09795 [Defluviitaleaceae bacterium]|nr:hypothetical protein [Defluviitaleaceae bacterium]